MRFKSFLSIFALWFAFLQCISPFVHMHIGNESEQKVNGLHIHTLQAASNPILKPAATDSTFSIQQDLADEHILYLDVAIKNKKPLIEKADIPFIAVVSVLLGILFASRIQVNRPFDFPPWSSSIALLFPSPRAPPAR